MFSACRKNQTEIIIECIRNGYDINKENMLFKTPVIFASQYNNSDAVEILAESGADLNIIDILGSTALGHAKNQSKVDTYLRNTGATFLKFTTEGVSKLKIEIQQKDVVSATTKEIINKIDSLGFSPFMWAIYYQSEDHFEHYLALGADVNQKCRNGTTPLMLACRLGNFKMIRQLVDNEASVNNVDDNGNSPLVYCTSHVFKSEIADFLIESGADVDNSGANRPTPLIVAANSINNLLALQYFLGNKADVNATDKTGNTAVAFASYSGKVDNVKILIDNGADLNLCGPKGKTPLSWAVIANNLEMVKLLLMNGAEIDQKDYKNYTALQYGKKFEHLEIVEYLEKAKETHPLRLAIQQNNIELVKSFVEKDICVCAEDNAGETPLITAIRAKNQEIVKYLLENGADLTVHSALPVAIELDDLEIIKILLENGAKVNKYYKSLQQTPLMQAISLRNMKMVRFLVENGASPSLTGDALEIAIKLKCNNIVKYLIEKGADVNQSSFLKLAIEQKNLRLIVLLINHGANVENDIQNLEEFSKENDDFMEFFNDKIASKFKANKLETSKN